MCASHFQTSYRAGHKSEVPSVTWVVHTWECIHLQLIIFWQGCHGVTHSVRGKNSHFQKPCWASEQLHSTGVDSLPHTIYKTNSELMTNVGAQTSELLKSTMRNLHVLELANGFSDAPPKTRATGKIRVKLELIKIKITFTVVKNVCKLCLVRT